MPKQNDIKQILTLFEKKLFHEVIRLTNTLTLDLKMVEHRKIGYARSISFAAINKVSASLAAFETFIFEADQPHEEEYWENFLRLLNAVGTQAQNEKAFDSVSQRYPTSEQLASRQANYYRKKLLTDKAITALERISCPTTPEWHSEMLQCLIDKRRIPQAAVLCNEHWPTFSSDPDFAIAALKVTARNLDAKTLADVVTTCLTRFSTCIPVLIQCATALAALGRQNEASRIQKKLLEMKLSPSQRASIIYSLSIKDPSLLSKQQIEHLLGQPKNSLNADAKANCYFALANVYKQTQDHKLYVQAIHKANQLKEHSISDTSIDFTELHQRASKLSEKCAKITPADKEHQPIIFVVGLPRCGSTIVANTIAQLYDAENIEESSILPILIQEFNLLNSDRDISPELLSQIQEEFFSRVPNFGQLQRSTHDVALVDKTLSNYLYLGVIRKAFPRSQIIWVRRERTQHVWSIYQKNFFSPYQRFAYSLESIHEQLKLSESLMSQKYSQAYCAKELWLEDFQSRPEECLTEMLGSSPWLKQRSPGSTTNASRISLTASKAQMRNRISPQTDPSIDLARKLLKNL